LISFIPKKRGGENKGKYVKETEKHGKLQKEPQHFKLGQLEKPDGAKDPKP